MMHAKFGHFRFIPRQRLLLAGNEEVRIGNRALDILAALIERAGQLVTKDELIASVWPHSFVEEINLRVHIAALRRALGDGQAGGGYILNTVGRGYSFIAPVTFEANERPLERRSPAPHYRATLPVPLTRMFGRARDLDTLIERVKTRRLVSIVGPAGVGKSTLAHVVANQFSEYFESGFNYVDFATIFDSSLVLDAIAAVIEMKMAPTEPPRDLFGVLNNEHLLLVFDNCDHVIDEIALLSERLLRRTQRLHILVTSREALGCEAEWRYGLHPLDVPDDRGAKTVETIAAFSAVTLFVDRVAASFPSFELNDSNAGSVADICRRLDGIPLAIDLSAARASARNVHDLASYVSSQSLEVINARRDSLPRHRSMRAALDWSIELLTIAESVLLQRLAIFRGAFTFDSAISVAARLSLDECQVSDGIMSLTEKSLVSTEIVGYKTRHKLLQITRTYVLGKLASSSDAPMINLWHAQAVLRTLHEAGNVRPTLAPAQWIEEFSYVMGDARAAEKWAFSKEGDAVIGERIAAALRPLSCAIDSGKAC